MWIYKLTNKINGKIYIGQTVRSMYERLMAYKWSLNEKANLNSKNFRRPIISALYKYGIENFSVEILCRCSSQEELNTMEIFLIALYRARDSDIGYNIAVGGEGVAYWLGKKLSEEAKRNMSIAKKGKPIRPEVLAARIGKNVGELNNSARLTWDIVRAIRNEYAQGGTSERKLGAKYNVSSTTIRRVITNKNWKE